MPKPLEVSIGQVFSRLTVVGETTKNSGGTLRKFVLAKCECGKICTVRASKLYAGATKSCGCLKRDRFTEFATSHGLRFEPEYEIWLAMRQRCNNPRNAQYKDYGGRGILVCPEWDDFAVFYSDMGPRPSSDLTLERLNNEQGYCKENCVWATREAQANNSRRNKNYAEKYSLTN